METLDIKTAFMYPFNRPKGMWNILWILLPIIGWLALIGYSIRIVKEFSKGKFKQLPLMNFSDDMKFGFFMLLKAIPFIIIYMVVSKMLTRISNWFSIVLIFVDIFIIPIMVIHFMNKETMVSFFEFNIVKSVFNNLGDYILVFLRSVVLGIIFALMIIILVGIPAGAFTKNIFIADFYRRRIGLKKSKNKYDE